MRKRGYYPSSRLEYTTVLARASDRVMDRGSIQTRKELRDWMDKVFPTHVFYSQGHRVAVFVYAPQRVYTVCDCGEYGCPHPAGKEITEARRLIAAQPLKDW